MNKQSKPRALYMLLCLSFMSLAATGCNAGDENPVSPEKMEEIRQKTNTDRANFKPPETGQRPN